MKNKTTPATSLTDSDERESVMATATSLVSEFERLLNSELHLLTHAQADGLQAVAEAKQVVINQLASIENPLLALFDEQSNEPEVQVLKHSLLKCRANNISNHDLVSLELKYTNKSLELLRSVLRMDDLTLYSQRGEVDMKREKRKFGRA